jgi:glycosyltransferase involved in cell wall biosynthesis
MPFIKHHIEEFSKTQLDWHWHIVEGLAELSHDTAWSLSSGGDITPTQRSSTLSNDGTSEYIDLLKKEYPNRISVYRKEKGILWDGKIEMVRAPLAKLTEECLLWQIDCDEHWNSQQIRNVNNKFANDEGKNAAWFWCNYYVGNDITITSRNCYAQNPNQEWLRVWKFQPGDDWTAHEPPILTGKRNGNNVDIGRHNPFMHDEMESIGAVFDHYAYVLPEQLKFKETYYGYKGALKQWQNLQLDIEKKGEAKLGDYFHWVKDETTVKKKKKTKIVYIDHAYHQHTKSTQFFVDILSTEGDVSIIWDKSHESVDSEFDMSAVNALMPDVIVIFQSEKAAMACALSEYTEVFFIPMYDSVMHASADFWDNIKRCKVINFSLTTYNECILNNIDSIYVQYFKKPEPLIEIESSKSKTAFFWQRRETPNINIIRPFLKRLRVKNLLFHNVPDPGVVVKRMPSFLDRIKYSIKETHWFKSAQEFKTHINKSGVYFAPRLEEGIGMSFLEALQKGQCVIAPDRGTMNEYITNGVNGILYSETSVMLENIKPDQLRINAIRSSVNGYKRWQDGIKDILRFIYGGKSGYPRRRILNRLSLTKRSSYLSGWPKITVCIVVKNAESQIEKTLESVLLQDYPNLEIIVKDGCSTDGTLKILEKYQGSIDLINSSNDVGIYDGMNQAVALASGEWVIYMNAGDSFFCKRSITNSFRNLDIPSDCGLIIGNNIYINNIHGEVQLQKSYFIEDTLFKIKNADYYDALYHIPCHQSVFTRKDLLLKYKYDCSFPIAADHDFYFKVINDGYTSIHTGEIISNYLGGGFSASNEIRLLNEWELIDLKYSLNKDLTKKYYSNLRANFALSKTNKETAKLIINIHEFYQNSLSWKITKPLRIISKYFYKILHRKYRDLDTVSINSFK